MCKYEQNIKKIAEEGIDPIEFYLRKTHEECGELQTEVKKVLIQNGNINDLISEIADIQNCIFYLKKLLKIDGKDIYKEMERKLDRALVGPENVHEFE